MEEVRTFRSRFLLYQLMEGRGYCSKILAQTFGHLFQ